MASLKDARKRLADIFSQPKVTNALKAAQSAYNLVTPPTPARQIFQQVAPKAIKMGAEGIQSNNRDIAGLVMGVAQMANRAVGNNNRVPNQLRVQDIPKRKKLANTLFGADQTIRTPMGSQEYLEKEYNVPKVAGLGLGLAMPILSVLPSGGSKKTVAKKAASKADDVAKGVDPKLKLLYEEARKYKSAEEFIAQHESKIKSDYSNKFRDAETRLADVPKVVQKGLTEKSAEVYKKIHAKEGVEIVDAGNGRFNIVSGTRKQTFQGMSPQEREAFYTSNPDLFESKTLLYEPGEDGGIYSNSPSVDRKQLTDLYNTYSTAQAVGNVADDVAKGVDPKLKPLYEEARKYKSAEEFADAQGALFRGEGTDVGMGLNIRGKGLYTGKKDVAKRYSKDGKLKAYKLSDDAKVLDANSTEYKRLRDKSYDARPKSGNWRADDKVREEALAKLIREAGYDALKAGYETVIFNIKKATDLTDLYNQAHKSNITYSTAQAVGNVADDVAKGVDPKLKPLYEEARKYKSAEEFVKAQGKPVYHGSNKRIRDLPKLSTQPETNDMMGRAFYVTDSKNHGGYYARRKNGDIVNELVVTKDANIVGFDDSVSNKLRNEQSLPVWVKTNRDAYNYLKVDKGIDDPNTVFAKSGIDGFTQRLSKYDPNNQLLKEQGDSLYTAIINPNKLQTPQQLTDLYNQAHKSNITYSTAQAVGNVADDVAKGKQILTIRSDAPRKLMVKAMKQAKKEGRTIQLVAPKTKVLDNMGKLLESPKKILALPEGRLPRVGISGGFKDTVRRFVGNRAASPTIATKIASEFTDIPVNKGEEFINHVEGVAQSTDEFVLGKARRWEEITNQLFSEMQQLSKRTKQDLGYVQGYITHIWKEDPAEVTQRIADLRKKSGFAETRKYATYKEGIEAGLTPLTTNPAEIMQIYANNIKTLESNLNFVDDLKASGFLASHRKSGFEPVVIPGISSSGKLYYAPKAISDKINNIFRQESIFSLPSKIAGIHQNVTMSGGVPFTSANAWTFGQIIKNLTTLSPYRSVATAKNFIRSNFKGASVKYFTENVDDMIAAQVRGIDINSSYKISNMIDGYTVKKAFGQQIGDFFNKATSNPTFERFAPMQVLEEFKHIKSQAIKQGLPINEAEDLAADATRMWMGMPDMADVVTRNREINDLSNTLFFAPRFRESMINFWKNNVKAISPLGVKEGKVVFNNPLALRNRANTMFMIGTMATVYGYEKANQAINGHGMRDNPPGLEDKLAIPRSDGSYVGIPIQPSLATIPRLLYRAGIKVSQADVNGLLADLKGLLSTSVRPIADVFTNQDWVGNQVYDPNSNNQGSQVAGYLGRELVAHPYLKELTDKRNQGDPLWERVTRASEAPVRFYEANSIKGKWFYSEKNKAMNGVDNKTRNSYEYLHPSKEPWETTVSTPDTVSVKQKMEKATIRANNPEVYFLERRIATATSQKTGQPLDPIYAVPAENALTYFRYQSLAPGSSDAKDMYKAYPEIGVIGALRAEFFKQNPLPESASSGPYDTKPQPSDYVQQQMDLKNWRDPDVVAYLEANKQWQNNQRMLLGMTPIDSGFNGYGSGKKKVKVPTLKIKLPKRTKALKAATLKTIKPIKLQNIKKTKAPK